MEFHLQPLVHGFHPFEFHKIYNFSTILQSFYTAFPPDQPINAENTGRNLCTHLN